MDLKNSQAPNLIRSNLIRGNFVRGNIVAAVLLFAASAAFLLNPHDDTYAGLDVAMYARMTEAFARGESPKGADRAFASVPESIRPLLTYRESGRITRDGVFEIDLSTCETKPFFVPTLPVAAAIFGKTGIPPRWFVPLSGIAWLAVLWFGAATPSRMSVKKQLFMTAMFFATIWPVWFLRGFYPEAAGGVLLGIAIVLKFASVPGENGSILRDYQIGLLLGLAVSFHYSLCVLALPIALCAILRDGQWRRTFALALGGGVGTLPLLLITKYVCQPYGNFLDYDTLAEMLKHPVIRVTAAAAAVAALAGGAVVTLAHNKKARAFFIGKISRRGKRINEARTKCVLFCLLVFIVALPYAVGGTLRSGAAATFGKPLLCMFLLVGWLILRDEKRPVSDRLLLLALCAASLVFMYIKGVEVPVGIWSQRRFTPVVICVVSLLAGTDFPDLRKGLFRWENPCQTYVVNPLACICMLAWALAFTFANKEVFTVSDGRGGEALRANLEKIIASAGDDALVVFDYFPHSFPHQNRKRAVFGINEYVMRRHGHAPVFNWLAGEAADGRTVLLVSSHDKPDVPEGVAVRLEKIAENNGSYRVLRGKGLTHKLVETKHVAQTVYLLTFNRVFYYAEIPE